MVGIKRDVGQGSAWFSMAVGKFKGSHVIFNEQRNKASPPRHPAGEGVDLSRPYPTSDPTSKDADDEATRPFEAHVTGTLRRLSLDFIL
jgi:hypothetical protein